MSREMTADERALVEAHLGLARAIARTHRPSARLHEDDRLSAAVAGLIAAAMRYAPGSGPFPAYAARSIRNAITDAVWLDRAVQVPLWLSKGTGRRSRRADGAARPVLSIHLGPDGDPIEPADGRPGPGARLEADERDARLRDALAGLDGRSRAVIDGLAAGKSDRRLAPELGIGRERVAEVRRGAIARLRAALGADDDRSIVVDLKNPRIR